MSESTLSIGYDDLRKEVGAYLGFGRTTANWSSDQAATILACVNSGLRQFYVPPPLPGEAVAHVWSFLRPVTTLVAWSAVAATAGVTVSTSGASATITSNTAVFYPTMIGKSIVITGSGTYTIIAYTSSTVVTISSTITLSASTFSIDADGDYRLPDDFAGLDSVMTLTTNDVGGVIAQTGESIIRQRRQQENTTGRPLLAAVVFAQSAESTTIGQRQNLMLWPIPETDYTISYRYRAMPNAMSGTNFYPYGGASHAETLISSCLAIAERRINDVAGTHAMDFAEKLRASVSLDRQTAAQSLGYNGDGSDVPRVPPMIVTYAAE